ncbi:MAG: fdrA domain protein [Rhodospirillales bacterium]|nr:fdrA domain protein [Rhodospirillales bacterium]
MTKPIAVFEDALCVINIGLDVFADDFEAEGIEVVRLDWRPSGGGDPRLSSILAQLDDDD